MPVPVERLYELPLGEFTSARNELAKELRRGGDHAAADEVAALKKPTVAAWAVNQLARRREVDVRRLLRAAEELERAQAEAVRGGDQRAFDRARRSEREAIRRLRAEAATLLREAGHPAGDATIERVAKTLRAAAATDDGRELLRSGRLAEELEPQGFEALAALAVSAPKRRSRPAKKSGPTTAERRRAQKARDDAEVAAREAREAEERLEEAERALRDAERAAAKTRRAAERARDRADGLAARASELEERMSS